MTSIKQRPIERIDRIQSLITTIWKVRPDMRYFQLIEFIKSKTGHDDLYYYEDSKLEELLKELTNE